MNWAWIIIIVLLWIAAFTKGELSSFLNEISLGAPIGVAGFVAVTLTPIVTLLAMLRRRVVLVASGMILNIITLLYSAVAFAVYFEPESNPMWILAVSLPLFWLVAATINGKRLLSILRS